MFFKRIEMTGFKSFATKTVVEFRAGVTIVVGPNGCGKSNIFDAIRWVLGERSAKSLRGTKMGDVIFQGSATYRPMGCAQVSLVINNEDGRLPLEFNEISITRRLYRSGDSEFLMNKVPCNLRDIHELFLDTGVGTDSYSVMEQAKANQIIQCRPEDRRQLFEEAAGISKYRERKATAMRKLENTENDLLRLDDQVRTCRRTRNSLKRQATMAERYNTLRESADLADMKIMTMDSQRLRVELAEAQKGFQKAEDRLSAARAQTDGLEARREELQLQTENLDTEVRELSQQILDQREYIHECEREIGNLAVQAEGEKDRARQLTQQIEQARVEFDEAAENLADANIEEARLSVTLIRMRARQQVRTAGYERMRADTDATYRKIRETRQAIDESTNRSLELQHRRNRLQMQIEQTGAALEELENEKRERTERLARLEAEIAEKQKTIEETRQETDRLKAQWETLRAEADEHRRARETLLGEHRKTERERNEAQSRLDALERLAQDYEGYYAGVKAVMIAAEHSRLSGVVGAVPELIQPIDSEHDLAIEVALGNHVQDVVVGTGGDAKAAVNFLKQERAGRATFLPLNLIDGREPSEGLRALVGRPGVVAVASDLVTYSRDIEPAVLYLLGRTIVTENIDVTLDLVRRGERHRYVTLDGELTSPAGAITGGSRKQSPLMARQREIAALTTRSRDLTERENDLAARIGKREAALAELQTRGGEIESAMQEQRVAMGRRETELASLKQNLEQERRAVEALAGRTETHRTQSQERRTELEAADKRVAEMEARGAELRGQLNDMEGAIHGTREDVDRLGHEVNRANEEIVRCGEQRARQREIAESNARQIQTGRSRIGQLRAEREQRYASARSHIERRLRVFGERRALEKQMRGIEKQRTKSARKHDKVRNELHALNTSSHEARQELTLAQNEHSELQVALVNARERLRSMDERARDHFDRDLDAVIKHVEEGGEIEETREELEMALGRLRREIHRMGENINLHALVEYKEEDERYQFLTTQQTDLIEARDSLKKTITTIDQTTRQLFWEAFEQIRQNFVEVYRTLFGGGKADLMLQDVEDGDALLNGGIEIAAQPPGKKLQNISLLSGGEQALTAVSLMFAIFLYKPSPFCVLDEIDAPLDDTNVRRFRDLLREFSARTQFIIITHNKITMELADTLHGITMQETGVSSVVSVDFDQAQRMVEAAS